MIMGAGVSAGQALKMSSCEEKDAGKESVAGMSVCVVAKAMKD